MKFNSLPTGYLKPKELKIASNTFINVETILKVNGSIPILIGDGDKPRIWLYIPANSEGTEWYPLIKDNFSTNRDVLVTGDGKSLKIISPQGTIIECKKHKDGVIEVTKLDLRIVGLDFFASGDTITFMGSSFSRSTFNNVGTMFAVGKE